MQTNEDLPSLTDAFHFVILFFTIILILGGIIFLVYAPPAIINLITAVSTILTCLLIFGALWLLKKLVVYLHNKYETGQLEQHKTNLLIGYGGIALCGIIPRIVVFFSSTNPFTSYYCITVSLATAFIFYCLFVFDRNRAWTINHEDHWTHIVISFVVQLILLVAGLKIGWEYEEDISRTIILPCQVLCAFCFIPVIIDFGIVLLGGLKLKNNQSGVNLKRQSVKVEQSKESQDNNQSSVSTSISTSSETHPRQECKICMLEYSETLIPRILKECGHTVCEGCADQLLKKNNKQHLFCPFCQNVTLVNGPASSLPKNFAIIDMIDEKKKNA